MDQKNYLGGCTPRALFGLGGLGGVGPKKEKKRKNSWGVENGDLSTEILYLFGRGDLLRISSKTVSTILLGGKKK